MTDAVPVQEDLALLAERSDPELRHAVLLNVRSHEARRPLSVSIAVRLHVDRTGRAKPLAVPAEPDRNRDIGRHHAVAPVRLFTVGGLEAVEPSVEVAGVLTAIARLRHDAGQVRGALAPVHDLERVDVPLAVIEGHVRVQVTKLLDAQDEVGRCVEIGLRLEPDAQLFLADVASIVPVDRRAPVALGVAGDVPADRLRQTEVVLDLNLDVAESIVVGTGLGPRSGLALLHVLTRVVEELARLHEIGGDPHRGFAHHERIVLGGTALELVAQVRGERLTDLTIAVRPQELVPIDLEERRINRARTPRPLHADTMQIGGGARIPSHRGLTLL